MIEIIVQQMAKAQRFLKRKDTFKEFAFTAGTLKGSLAEAEKLRKAGLKSFNTLPLRILN